MAKIRVESINNDKILISQDNKNADCYEKSKSSWSATSGSIIFTYDGDVVFTEKPTNFEAPKESSVHDLILPLDALIN